MRNRHPIFTAISGRPVWQQMLLGLILTSVAAYYATEIVLLAFGQPSFVLADPIGLAVNTTLLIASGSIGLLFRRPFVVGIVFALLGEAFLIGVATHSSGDAMSWTRQSLGYLTPAVAGLLLELWRNAFSATSATAR